MIALADEEWGFLQAVEAYNRNLRKENCRIFFDQQRERVAHFCNRIAERGLTAEQVCIVLISVDDAIGGPLAEQLMPGHDWQPYRDAGEMPVARGLAARRGILEVISALDPAAGEVMKACMGIAVVVVLDQTISVFRAQ